MSVADHLPRIVWEGTQICRHSFTVVVQVDNRDLVDPTLVERTPFR